VDSSRLEAFSDGVFAVAITLLALDLAVAGPGHGPLFSQLSNKWPAFVAYAVSFLTIGIIWVNHHALFRNFASVDRMLMFLNLLLLFFVVSIPFATATMSTYMRTGGADSHLGAALFLSAFEGMSLAFGAIFWWSIHHERLRFPLGPSDARRAFIRFGIGNLTYVVGIGVAFLSAYAAMGIAAINAVYYMFEQTPRGAQDVGGRKRAAQRRDAEE
jgi:uncharacterized membrane protein